MDMESDIIIEEKKNEPEKITCQTKKFLGIVSGEHVCSSHCIQAIIAVAAIATLLIIFYQMVIQTRAWITVKGVELSLIKEGQPVKAQIVFRNSGKSPALDVVICNNINIYKIPPPDPMPYGGYDGPTSRGVIGPDSDVSNFISKKEKLSSQELRAILHRKAAIYVYGHVEYRDIFRCKRNTEYCFVNKPGTLNFDACPNNNNAN